MSENIKETITVSFMGKFGPSVNGVWYSLSPKSGLTPQNFEKDKTYQVLVYTSKTGKKYINQIVGENVVPAEVHIPLVHTVASITKEDTELMEKQLVKTAATQKPYQPRDFDREARGKVACAIITSLNQSPWLGMYALNKEDAIKLVKELAIQQIEDVFELQDK